MRAKLIQVDNRLSVKYNKVEGIFNFGDDNAYPSLIKSLVGSSVTGKQCVDLNSKYIYGKGFRFEGKTTIVNKNGLTLNQLLRIASKEFSEQNNLFFHVNFNALHQIISATLLPTSDVRIGKSDSNGYSGKFVVYDNWDKSISKKTEKKNFQLIDRFNPNPAVIDAQVEASGGWSKYKGQILHINSDFCDLYSLSDGDTVLLDMDSEYQARANRNSTLRKGFHGVKLMVTKPFADDYERREFTQSIQDVKGSESSNGVILLEAKNPSDELDKEFFLQEIASEADTSMSDSSDSAEQIRKAFGVPSILIEDSDNSIFGNSGELIIQAKKLHWENKEEERNLITEAFAKIFSKWHEPINPTNDWEIIPIIEAL